MTSPFSGEGSATDRSSRPGAGDAFMTAFMRGPVLLWQMEVETMLPLYGGVPGGQPAAERATSRTSEVRSEPEAVGVLGGLTVERPGHDAAGHFGRLAGVQ